MRKIALNKMLGTFAFLILSISMVNAQGIDFRKGKLEDVLAEARDANKLVFVDVYTTWCGPCKHMVKNIFPLEEVGTFYNKNFINYKVDAEDAKVNGPEIAQKYKVGAYPTYLFLNGQGELVSSVSGAMEKEVLIKVGQQALGYDMTSDFDVLLTKYKNGDHSEPTLKALIASGNDALRLIEDPEERNKIMEVYNQALAKYISRAPEKFINAEDLNIISNQGVYFPQRLFRGHVLTEYIIDNYQAFNAVVEDEERLATFLMHMNYFGIQSAAAAGNKELYQQYLADITGKLKRAYTFNDEQKMPAISFLTALGNSEYAISQKDYDSYFIEYDKILELNKGDLGAIDYLMPARRLLNMGKGTPTKEQLEKCIPYNEIAYNKYKNAYVVTDYGLLMAKIGELDKARAYYNEAFEMFGEMGDQGKALIKRFEKEMQELGL